MLSCNKATELIEKQKVFKLSFIDQLKLKFHVSICDACKNFKKQSDQIDHYMEHLTDKNPEEIKLSDEAKTRIKEKLKEE